MVGPAQKQMLAMIPNVMAERMVVSNFIKGARMRKKMAMMLTRNRMIL